MSNASVADHVDECACGAIYDVDAGFCPSLHGMLCGDCGEPYRRVYRESSPRCPYCDRVMTFREKAEQGACDNCYGH
jgi:DNA-directed RNA polymerase subunit RPC12/RpoP